MVRNPNSQLNHTIWLLLKDFVHLESETPASNHVKDYRGACLILRASAKVQLNRSKDDSTKGYSCESFGLGARIWGEGEGLAFRLCTQSPRAMGRGTGGEALAALPGGRASGQTHQRHRYAQGRYHQQPSK